MAPKVSKKEKIQVSNDIEPIDNVTLVYVNFVLPNQNKFNEVIIENPTILKRHSQIYKYQNEIMIHMIMNSNCLIELFMQSLRKNYSNIINDLIQDTIIVNNLTSEELQDLKIMKSELVNVSNDYYFDLNDAENKCLQCYEKVRY